MPDFATLELGRHAGFIIASYGAAIVVMGGLAVRAIWLHRRAVAALKALAMNEGRAP